MEETSGMSVSHALIQASSRLVDVNAGLEEILRAVTGSPGMQERPADPPTPVGLSNAAHDLVIKAADARSMVSQLADALGVSLKYPGDVSQVANPVAARGLVDAAYRRRP